MRILQTPARFYPYIGGVENYVYCLSRELVNRGHEVKVVCAEEAAQGREEIHGIEVDRLKYVGKIANTNITPSLPLHLLRSDFDVIHTHLPTPWSADWSAFASAVKGKPLVLTYHDDIVGDGVAGYLARFYNASFLKFLLGRAEKIVISHSRYMELSYYLSGYKNKVEVVPPGVDVEMFYPGGVEAEDTVFFLGVLDEFHRYKGLDILLEAIKSVKKEIPGVRLKVGGDGRLLDYYIKRAASLGLEENVVFLGSLPWDEIPEHYRSCSLFVLPSTSASQEGFGMVLLEALACARPVVSTSIVGAAEDIKKYRAGIIVDPMDSRALAKAIVELLTNREKAMEMGVNGRKLVEEKYTWKKIAESIEKIYNSLEP
jgi:glycosyltransferase involved in cell wall biosynthesis